jgi:DTW domain-containing protein
VTCLCSLCVPVANQVPVLVLQHPDERRQAKGSVSLLRLSLAQCVVEVGQTYEPQQLQRWLRADGRGSVLLYPSQAGAVPALSAQCAASTGEGVWPQLVLLDATWGKSLRMLMANPLLQALPRWPLVAPAAGRYGALRRARRSGQLSTLEACCQALAQVEQAPARYAGLLQAFDHFVTAQLKRAPVPTALQDPAP